MRIAHVRALSRTLLFDKPAHSRPSAPRLSRYRPQAILLFGSFVIIAFCFSLLLLPPALDDGSSRRYTRLMETEDGQGSVEAAGEKSPSSLVLRGIKNDTAELNIRARLMEDRGYLTAGIHAGWTNTVMSIAHIIHLSLLSNRTPIIPPFLPHPIQLGYAAPSPPPSTPIPFLDVSEVFNLPHLLSILSQPTSEGKPGLDGIVEWSELVDTNREKRGGPSWDSKRDWEELGCWSQWVLHGPTATPLAFGLERIRIKSTYTPLPASILARNTRPPHILLPAAASLFTPGSSAMAAYIEANNGSTTTPDEHLTCIDGVYFATDAEEADVRDQWRAPEGIFSASSWNVVGRHLRWTDKLLSRTFDALRETFDVLGDDLIPGFISMHVRHGDFLTHNCPFRLSSGPLTKNGRLPYDPDRCLPLSSYEIALNSVIDALASDPPIYISPTLGSNPSSLLPYPIETIPSQVLVTTDSEDPEFVDAIKAKGWTMIPKETIDRLRREDGDWYPMLVENVALSLGKGFVGTEGSTMSILNGRRVQEWHSGPKPIYVGWDSPY